MSAPLSVDTCLPEDRHQATLIGSVWLPDADGPALVHVQDDAVYDLSSVAVTCSELLNLEDPAAAIRDGSRRRIGSTSDLLANSWADRREPRAPWFLAPCDLQTVKASGVTFVASLL